jgi:hypothetical protein
VESGWKGDLYGKPKGVPLGMIWVFLIAFAFPWIQIVLYKLWKNRTTIFKNEWVSFLVLWAFWTPIFFTISSNILHTYLLPTAIPIMFLIVYWWEDFTRKKVIIRTALIFPTVVFIAYFGFFATGQLDYKMNSDKYLLENLKTKNGNKEIPFYYWQNKNYSGQFYTNGKAQVLKNEAELDSVLSLNKQLFFVIPTKKKSEIPQKYLDKMTLAESNYKTSIFETK